jgi:hypothetical protein
MQTEYLVAIDEFCTKHNIEVSFISSLQETGLIEITMVDDAAFIQLEQLQEIEKFIRFYYELDINIEGIETISHLLHRVNELQKEIVALRNKVGLYE